MRIKDVEKLIGKENIPAFHRWMHGQTVGTYEDGEINYYDWDVTDFWVKLKTGNDRQENPYRWD